MRLFSSIYSSFLCIALVGGLTACSSGVKLNNPAPIAASSASDTSSNDDDNRAIKAVDVSADPLNDPQGPLSTRSIYFDLDSYSVKDSYKDLLETHAKYLLAHPNRKILIQGNTDERGTSEYNLALGQKRAEAVLQALKLMGVPEAQMEAVSLGKEKPKAAGHAENDWAENRRADIVYP